VKKALLAHGLTPQPTTRQGLAAFMKKEYAQQGGQGAQADRQLSRILPGMQLPGRPVSNTGSIRRPPPDSF
jgi:hypothetical protein